ncbi:anti-sigma factor family protein [Streptomyces bluensis]|uniref:anti-sigma factor family protein n=1 Tax=Streptomyces bluensis TaxID=33897 RepID=UPI00332DE6B7
MTSTTETAEHPEITELSDLTEGLLPPSRSADVRQHLDECPLCADVYASLEEIRGMLGTLPGPPRMPADIAGRIDAALAAEALLNSTAPDHQATHATTARRPADVSPPELDENNGAHVSRETSPPTDRPMDRPSGHSRGATGPGRPGRKRSARRRVVVVSAVFTVAALGLGTLLAQSMGGTDSGDNPGTDHSQDTSVSIFSGDTVKSQVETLLAENHSAGKASGGQDDDFRTSTKPPGSKTDGPNVFNTVDVPSCITEGIGRSESPLAAKEGEYKKAPAYLVVMPDASHTDRVTAYVVDAACVSKTPTSPGDVLLKHSYPRPSAAPSSGR